MHVARKWKKCLSVGCSSAIILDLRSGTKEMYLYTIFWLNPELFYPVMNQPMIIVVQRPISANTRLNFNPPFLLLLCEKIFKENFLSLF